MKGRQAPRVLLRRSGISATVRRLAADISQDYREKNPLLIGVLKGSFIFMSDLVRALDFPLEVDFVRLSSYRRDSVSGELRMGGRLPSGIRGRHVVVVEDIVDTGQSLGFLMGRLAGKGPASLKLCVFADKPSRRCVDVKIDYLGLTVPDKFIVGYGLDLDEKYRNLPYLGYVEV